ncbi:Multidrug resistance protein 1 [Fasciola hepatica]|uniref:Multidrug resistance protein 1 n=1 Tax=Fasciola hepatica TaxID=6192 RepID=A0A4E0RLC9_FASHE|nr:Multidrug resistance protein 1 [Fasciola hepatica]
MRFNRKLSSLGNAKSQKADPGVSFFKLFSHADLRDKMCIVFGFIFSVASGAGFPLNVLIFRSIIDQFIGPSFDASLIYGIVKWFAVLGACLIVLTFLQSFLFGISAQRQSRRIRVKYFKAVLRQDVPWFDTQSSGSLMNKLTQNIDNIEEGIGSKFGEFILNLSGFFCGLIIAFFVGWKLTLVACAMVPFVVTVFLFFGVSMKYFTMKELDAYSRASAISGEVLSAIRTVMAFGGEKKEFQRYSKELGAAQKMGIIKSAALGGVVGAIGLTLFSSAALIFWYGIELIITENYSGGTVVTVFINVVIGSIFLGNALPNMQYFLIAMASATEVYGLIDRVPPIDKDRSGKRIPDFTGNIIFKDVDFAYPTRPDIVVLKKFNLELKSGQTVALVGPSGSGKSTIVHMLQRFYDPIGGEIIVEGENIRDLDLKAFRAQLGCVQQEPILFEGTVEDNIRLGKLDATNEEIIEAAKMANAHDFILHLPEGYKTVLAERGAGLSGGQKQRIAIARALIRKPKLLLLDEATSALDTRSERVVQEALDQASAGRTVVVVAHRLTTVRNADLIMVLDKGVIREKGTHDELVERNGLYAAMLHIQKQTDKNQLGEAEPVDDIGLSKKTNLRNGSNGAMWTLADDDNSVEFSHASPQLIRRVSEASINLGKKIFTFKRSPIFRILKMNRTELGYIIGGCVASLIAGAVQPSFALLYSQMFQIFTYANDPEKMRSQVSIFAALMVFLGCLRFLGMLGQGFFFGVSGERLTRRVRGMLFQAIMRQEIGWFDRTENQPGTLTAVLATEASKMKSLSGSQLGFIIEAFALVTMSLVIAFIYSWQLTLLMLAFYPMFILSGMLQIKRIAGEGSKETDGPSTQLAQEAISSDRTVFTLNLEDYFQNRFEDLLMNKKLSNLKQTILFAVLFSLTQAGPMFCFAAAFTLGAFLVEHKYIEMLAVFRVFAVLNMSAQSLGRTASIGPETQRAREASKIILKTLDRTPSIRTDDGLVPREPFRGNVEFKHVYFSYPTRKTISVLKKFSHAVNSGETVALVGESGCGKSTLLQLVQRFYDPDDFGSDSGIFFDGHNIRQLAPAWVRRQIGIVSQEPNLFDMSIRDNIAYGDNSREVTMDEIMEAARQANVHEFITTLPEGYDTSVGQKGSHLSGGQKQRVAIARALLRKPILLLLDEATSALDVESERVVQEALDSAMGSRTCLMVAHRLSTVENADLIVVLENGRKIEAGAPEALLNAKGAFYTLHHTENAATY